jgi:hypothetical protein
MLCRCPRCATARRRATGTDAPVPLADVIARAIFALRSHSPVTDGLTSLAPLPRKEVHRESSVLLQTKDGGPITARLAFPAAEIAEVATADRRHRFDSDVVTLSKDGLTLTFAKPDPVEVIPARVLFVPKGSPQSYAARVGHPDESLMYRPGRWFHDRNVEVTYRRRDEKIVPVEVVGSLPKTAARLKAGEQTRAIIDRIRAADKEIEVVLVAPMLGHGEWTATPRDMFPKYRDELKKLVGEGVALADVTAVWEMMLKSKHDLDLTGNGLNHPNDFGHRLYAQAVLSVLIDRK